MPARFGRGERAIQRSKAATASVPATGGSGAACWTTVSVRQAKIEASRGCRAVSVVAPLFERYRSDQGTRRFSPRDRTEIPPATARLRFRRNRAEMPGVHALAAPDTAALPDAAELDGVLRELLEQVGDLMLADGCALLAPGEDGALAVRAAHGDLAGVDGGEGGWLAAPLHAGGEELGVLQVARTRGPEFDDRDASLLELLADRVALEIRQGAVLLRHTTAWALRRSLVRARLPSLPGIELA